MTQLHDHNPPAPLSRRRFSVRLAYGAWAVMLLVFLALLLMGGDLWKAPLSLLAVLTLLGAFLTKAAASGLPTLQDPHLDERERTRLTEAYALAHRFSMFAVGTAFAVITLLNLLNVAVIWPKMNVWSALLTTTFVLFWLLPTAILAWTEPDLLE